MKDWKAECEKMKGIVIEIARDRDRYRQMAETRAYKDEELTRSFKKLLLQVLED